MSRINGTVPEYYKSGNFEVIDFIDAFGFDFHLGNVIKYVARAGYKPYETRLDDLEKALYYLEREIAQEKYYQASLKAAEVIGVSNGSATK